MKATFDASELLKALAAVEGQLRSKLATAATAAARRARSESIKELARELHLQPKEIAGAAAAEIRRASPSTLTATWTPSTRTANIALTGTVKFQRGSPLTFASPSHGGDKERVSRRGFMLKGHAVHRVASAAGQKSRYAGLRSLRTIKPNTLIGQTDTLSARRWEAAAQVVTPVLVAGAIEAAFRDAGFSTTSTGETSKDD